MAAIAAAAAAFTTLRISKPTVFPRRRFCTLVASSLSSEFNITFASPKPKSIAQLPITPAADLDPPEPSSSELGEQLLIPWIVRDENGNLTLQTTPPELYLRAMAEAKTQRKKKKVSAGDAKKGDQAKPSTVPPKYSKAARRFYNERFREPPQRLAKVLAAAGGEFAQKISHPSSNLSKEYIATIDGVVNKKHLLAISEGTVIEGAHCTPDVVEQLAQQPDIKRPRLRIVVHEGRNHEVRELVKNAGLQIHALKRLRIGGFRLPSDLTIGKHMELSSANLRTLGWKS